MRGNVKNDAGPIIRRLNCPSFTCLQDRHTLINWEVERAVVFTARLFERFILLGQLQTKIELQEV